ncbi:hypothetical protein CA223_08150 [Sphingomonas koreensis]|jgi:hypothetical protein|uniref:Uncharacterized protein n=1 Tax=Sphingomonas koreensis TaxID=93064 RepID=A0A1L6J7G9_9SPHN|nr:hypothetical protein [Sphingomonas koreensis]APR51766.1 hypothetical protein BRX40_04330 [Sphingomonas koreensis]MDC7811946.1 hypothetical protein [Sphingomonas koreensis]RSU21383.1 hypothetical protein CA224_07810 [Sphingomonas koreensis]RSU23625.1 hypothetical protein CA222_14985 [Sphingomonas koreensis]RSU32052.1 hypothetical protein CA225_01675 [Sphingomonas koreensis]
MTDAPPGRYKVVERGRRLVVIDTRSGQPATHEARPAPPSPAVLLPAGIEQDTPRSIDDQSGHAVLTTSRLYDLKGPRRIVISDAASNRMNRSIGGIAIGLIAFAILATFFPLLLLLPVALLFQPKARAAFRTWMTARLDEADQAAS